MRQGAGGGREEPLQGSLLSTPAKQEPTSRSTYSFGTESVYTNYSNTVSDDLCAPGSHPPATVGTTQQDNAKFIELLAQRIKRLEPTKRAKEEHDMLAKLSGNKGNANDPKSQYVFDVSWIDYYKMYLNSGGSKLNNIPKPIDNRPIEEKIRQGNLKKDDYYTVNENVARLLYLIYGGGPVMTVQNTEEMKRDTESRSNDTFLTPSKLFREPREGDEDLKSRNTRSSMESSISALYNRTKKTKSSLERRYANYKGWIPVPKDILEDSSTIYNCKHRGDSPVGSMDEEEASLRVKARTAYKKHSDVSPPRSIGELETIKSIGMNTQKGTLSTAPSEINKVTLLEYIEKAKMVSRTGAIDFQRDIKQYIHKKVVQIISDPTFNKDQEQEDVLLMKYSQLKQHLAKQKLNALENSLVYCYVNSVLQFLFTIPELMAFFSPKNSSLFKGKSTCEEFLKIAEQYQSADQKIFNASGLLNCFKKKMEVHNQQDVDELLRLLIDQLHQELKSGSKKKPPIQKISNSKLVWQSYCQQEDSVITYLFTGEIKRKTVCLHCLFESDIRETFDILSLSLVRENSLLEEVIDSNFDPELIDSGYQCSNCKKKAPATSKLFMTKLPRYLIIQLKRFLMFPSACKNGQPIKYGNSNQLDLRKY
jgi:ubiquitin C-terminal hydrolase